VSDRSGGPAGRKVTLPDGRSQFWVGDPKLSGAPSIVEGFDVDNDVLVIDRPNLTRADLGVVQRGADTVIEIIGHGPVATIRGVRAADLDPTPLVRRLYEAFGRGDLDGVLELVADDVLWEVPGPTDILPWAGAWRGRDGVAEFFKRLSDTVAVESFEPTRFIAQGNTVAVLIDDRSRSRATGKTFAHGVAHWITVRNGRIAAFQGYMDTYPIVEAFFGGRPFTVPANPGASHYVSKPVPSKRDTDSIVFDPSVFETPSQTVQVVRRMYAALQALDVPRVREVFAPDVLWDIFGPPDLLSWAGPRRGPDAAAESANQILETMHFDYFKPTRMISQGDTVAVTIDEGGTSTATGLAFKTSVVHIVSANDQGRVVLFRNYINTADIVEAFLGGRPFTVPELGRSGG
jgi:ketosteroid isomerase-like protein